MDLLASMELSDAVLLRYVEKHRDTCNAASTCEICKLKNHLDYITQCDLCRTIIDTKNCDFVYYKCVCDKSGLTVCMDCTASNHYDIIEEPGDNYGDVGSYNASCCGSTIKSAKK